MHTTHDLRRLALLCAISVGSVISVASQAQGAERVRGDANGDNRVDIADPIFLLSYIFGGGKAPTCIAAANANADKRLDISDPITILTYLFASPTPLPPLTADDIAACTDEPPPPAISPRHGSFQDVLDPPHGIAGSKVEVLSDGSVKLSPFYYDATGFPDVVVQLTKGPFEQEGIVISGTLLRDHAYEGETLVFPLPPGVTDAHFGYVNIWCNYFPLHYAIARLYDGPTP